MNELKNNLNSEEKKQIKKIIEDTVDYFGDFYLTKNNIRFFIKDNQHLLFNDIKNGDKIIYNQDGIIIVTGYADNHLRKYIKTLFKNFKTIDKLLRIINTEIKESLYIKIKKNNPIKKILLRNNFIFKGDRGKEILLIRRPQNDRNKN